VMVAMLNYFLCLMDFRDGGGSARRMTSGN
jgi:hypothetical protein